jgi:hypothetical protein
VLARAAPEPVPDETVLTLRVVTQGFASRRGIVSKNVL